MTGELTAGLTAVVFDFYGTLTPASSPEVWATHTARLATAMGVPAAELGQALADTFPDRITGALGGVRHTLQALGARLGVQLTSPQLDEVVAIRQAAQESMFTLRPEALTVIAALRHRGLKIGLLSDCTAELPDAWARLPLATLVDAPVFSCLERTRKPDPRLFRTVAAALPADPPSCLYVGDGGGGELTGASAIGMRAVLLAGPDWHEHRLFARDRETGWTGPRISSLTGLFA